MLFFRPEQRDVILGGGFINRGADLRVDKHDRPRRFVVHLGGKGGPPPFVYLVHFAWMLGL